DPAFAEALERQIVVCYTGQSRVSGATIARVMGGFQAGDPGISAALHGLVTVADQMAEALLAADLAQVGRLLRANWELQQRLDPGRRTEPMHRREVAMDQAGSLGGKAAGAGAGGTMFFLMSDPAVGARVARELGVMVCPLRWSARGVELC